MTNKSISQALITFAALCFLLIAATNCNAQSATTVEGFPFCQTQGALDEFTTAIMNRDEDTFSVYIALGVCDTFNASRTKVYIQDSHNWGTIVEFKFQGVTAFTVTEGLRK